MNSWNKGKKWLILILCIMVATGGASGAYVMADSPEVLDQEQASWSGNSFVNRDYPRYQTFTPAITGNLSRIDLNIFDSYNGLGAIQIKIYKESDLSTAIAEAKTVVNYASGWTSVNFSGESAPYIKRETQYRMIVSTENGGSNIGFGWYMGSGNPYPRGSSPAANYDYSFRTYMIADYSISMEESRIVSTQASLIADGTSQSTITVTLKDAQGTPLTDGGESVAITSTLGTVSAVTDNQNGTYSATLTAPTTAGKATISATVGGKALTATSTVNFVPGTPSPTSSVLETSKASLTANGTSQTAIKVTLKDAQGNRLTSGGESVAITSTLGTVSAVTDNQDGTYSATLTAPTTVGTATISAAVGGNALTATSTVEFAAGSSSLVSSVLETSNASLVADGTSQTAIKVTLKDAQGNRLTGGGESVAITSTLGTVSAVTDNQDGTYSATLTAPTTVGTAAISATVGGNALTTTSTVEFVPGPVSSFQSTVTAKELVVPADGRSAATILVKLTDNYGNPLPGQQVLLQADGGASVIHDAYGWTSQDGTAVFQVSNTAAERVTYAARSVSSEVVLDQTVEIAFVYEQPPKIELHADPADPTFDSVKVTVTATAYGQLNNISMIKWAAGAQSVSYFDTQGTEITDHFEVQENGIYAVYVKDAAGNANVSQIDVQNIVKKSSNGNLSDWKVTGVGGVLALNFDQGKTTYTIEATHAVNGLSMVMTVADSYSVIDVNGQPVTSGSSTVTYPLVVGMNTFNVRVTAQDQSVQTYQLNVNRAAASSIPGPTPTPNPGSNPSPSGSTSAASHPSDSSLATSVRIKINDQEVSGIAKLQADESGKKFVEIAMDMTTLKKVLDGASAETVSAISIAYEQAVAKVVLKLPADAVKLLVGKVADITLVSAYGQYRLPLSELVLPKSGVSGDTEARITIELGDAEAITGLKDAAIKGALQIAGHPVDFNVQAIRNGVATEVNQFSRYVERAIYLPSDQEKVTTIMVWDEAQKELRPVPTRFVDINGHPAAIIQSLTNSVYVPVSRTSTLTDIKNHWASAEISKMNERMIVQGINGSRFMPDASITRAELATILARALGLPDADAVQGEGEAGYKDVSSSSWYSGAVATVKAYGMMDGFEDGTFRPEREVSRQEAIVTLVRSMQLVKGSTLTVQPQAQVDLSLYADSHQIGSWANAAMQTAIQIGLVKGYGEELRPQRSLTRAETTVLLYRMLLQTEFIDGSM
ncbi:invasin domain 3-containing protein [Paenibacillus sp. FSL W7-1088]|uniref:invasin domain 3-containing protein n=1 Tax=Paenibacillus sp. FSL W7-1088 TaxID=2921695 RepID=UPI0030EC1359